MSTSSRTSLASRNFKMSNSTVPKDPYHPTGEAAWNEEL